MAAERKGRLKRFGEATKEQAGDSVTVRQAEDIPFERIQKTRQTTEEKRAEKEDLKSALAGSDKSAVVGRWVPDRESTSSKLQHPSRSGTSAENDPHGMPCGGRLHATGARSMRVGGRQCAQILGHAAALQRIMVLLQMGIGAAWVMHGDLGNMPDLKTSCAQPAGHALPAADGAAARAGARPDCRPGAAARRGRARFPPAAD